MQALAGGLDSAVCGTSEMPSNFISLLSPSRAMAVKWWYLWLDIRGDTV